MGYKLILTLVLVCSSMFGQSTRNVVFANPVTGYHASNIAQAVLGAQYMIGQSNHLAIAVFSDITAASCTHIRDTGSLGAPLFDIWGSYDNTNFDPVGTYTRIIHPQAGTATDRARMQVFAVGAFPYIKIILQGFNNTDCKVTLQYYGTSSSLVPDRSLQFNWGTVDAASLTTLSINSATTALVVPSLVNSRIAVYSYCVVNSAASVVTITLSDLRIDTTVATLWQTTLPAGGSVCMPNTEHQYMMSSMDGSLQLTSNNTNLVTGYVLYRWE